MRRKLSVIAAGAAVVGGVIVGPLVGAAHADHGQTIPLTCGGTTYLVTTNGNGDWTPARDQASTKVFHPTSFGQFTGTFTPSDGSPPQTVTEPPSQFQAQPQTHNNHDTVSCTFTFTDQGPDGTFQGSGSVVGWVS